MHCWKTINIEYEYGTTRLFILGSITFVLVFCFAYITLSFNFVPRHEDHYFWVIIFVLPLIYPLHKFIHYCMLFDYRKNLVFRLKVRFIFLPIVHMRLQQFIPKKRYIMALLGPFIFLNGTLLAVGFYLPQYAHLVSLLLAFHCSICLLDILYVKNLMAAPTNAIIEETPKGYEILVPLTD